ncbi:uncharacterized protein CXorf66 homolog [Callospermophilus lateralis]
MESKMDNFRRHLLIIIIGLMTIAFIFTCFCFLHYNCMNEDAHKAGMEKCLVCKTTSETLVHISESKKENAGNLFSSSNMKSFTRSFQKVDSKDDVYSDNVTDSDMMTYDSDDSEREIIIICNIRSNHIVPYGTSKK